MKKLIFALLFCASPAGATTYFNNPPNIFVQGNPGDTCDSNPSACAIASEVNANFNQLITDGNAGYTTLKSQIDAITGTGAPVGAVIAVNSVSCPPGFIVADGTAGSADARGVFIRGLSSGGAIDSGRALNTFQDDQFETHGHTDFSVVTALTAGISYNSGATQYIEALTGTSNHTDTTSTSNTETRPDAVVLLYCYKN